jgi:DNA-binding LacI/PurR family transcriptional regulator
MDYIVSDDVSGGYIAVQYLLGLNYSTIYHFAGPDYVSSAFERKQGYLKALTESGIKIKKDWIIQCDITLSEETDTLIRGFLAKKRETSAIFTYNDIIAFRIINIARQMGVKIPDVVGYDNIQSKIDLGFALPSVNTHKSFMAEKAAVCLFARIEGQGTKTEYMNEVVPVDLAVK